MQRTFRLAISAMTRLNTSEDGPSKREEKDDAERKTKLGYWKDASNRRFESSTSGLADLKPTVCQLRLSTALFVRTTPSVASERAFVSSWAARSLVATRKWAKRDSDSRSSSQYKQNETATL